MVFDASTNRIVGGSYDANGNMLNVQGATLAYDVENRVVSATVSGATEYYQYTPGNQRIWKLKANGTLGKLQTRWFGYKDSDFPVLK
jgi:hypothetical protein